MIKLVIFDLDDTLISEKKFLEEGYRVVAKSLNSKYMLDEEKTYDGLIKLFKSGTKNVFNAILDENFIEYTNDDILELVTLYRTYPRSNILYPDVLPFLNLLKEKNISIGIITDGPIEAQKNKLNSINAYDIFDNIILTDELGIEYRKPNPISFNQMIKKTGALPEETMFIADNPAKDFYIKKTINMLTVRIIREDSIYKNEPYLCKIKEDIRVSGLGEIRI